MNNLKEFFQVIKDKDLLLAKVTGSKISSIGLIKKLFDGKTGLEIGGPSKIFRNKGFIPIYKAIKELDGCNFSNSTLWEEQIQEGGHYNYYNDKNGTQHISEATELTFASDSQYDFVISSNCLEHVANAMKAIHEWKRVIKKDGLLLLVVPNKKFCFDHKRPFTEFPHFLEDFKNNTGEDDLTHLDEILRLHDLKKDKRAGNLEQFKARSLKNYENRALHHHVFNLEGLTAIFNYFKLNILLTHEGRDFVILGQKSSDE